MSEAELQRVVLALARLLNWRVAHFRAGRTLRGGWRVPVEADAAGWPDLVLVKGRRLLFRELKSAVGRLSDAQREWLAALSLAGADAWFWTPADWRSGRIEAELRGEG